MTKISLPYVAISRKHIQGYKPVDAKYPHKIWVEVNGRRFDVACEQKTVEQALEDRRVLSEVKEKIQQLVDFYYLKGEGDERLVTAEKTTIYLTCDYENTRPSQTATCAEFDVLKEALREPVPKNRLNMRLEANLAIRRRAKIYCASKIIGPLNCIKPCSIKLPANSPPFSL